MNSPKRKAPSRLMASMQDRVSNLEGRLVTDSATLNHTFEVEVSHIEPDPTQARKSFSETSLRELASSLKEHGQLQPILVRQSEGRRGDWVIVAGERRWRAAKLAGLETLLVIERNKDHEPPRDWRRPVCTNYAAMGTWSRAA